MQNIFFFYLIDPYISIIFGKYFKEYALFRLNCLIILKNNLCEVIDPV